MYSISKIRFWTSVRSQKYFMLMYFDRIVGIFEVLIKIAAWLSHQIVSNLFSSRVKKLSFITSRKNTISLAKLYKAIHSASAVLCATTFWDTDFQLIEHPEICIRMPVVLFLPDFSPPKSESDHLPCTSKNFHSAF